MLAIRCCARLTSKAFELTGDTYDVIVDTMSYLYEARTLNGNTTLLR